MTNADFGFKLNRIREGYECVTEKFIRDCNEQQYQYVLDHLERKPFNRLMAVMARTIGKFKENRVKRMFDASENTETWD